MNNPLLLEELKEKVATACRLIFGSGLGDYSGHVSVRVPGKEEFLINGVSANRSTLSSSDIIVCNMQGESLTENDRPPMEVPIHTQIYKHRPDIQSIAHFHPEHAVILSMVNRPIEPVSQKGPMVGTVPIHADPRHIATVEQGEAVARTLGNGRAVMLRGHGAVVVGPSVEGTFYLSVCLEENAKRYKEALLFGEPQIMSKEEQEDILRTGYKPEWFQRVWNYYLGKIK